MGMLTIPMKKLTCCISITLAALYLSACNSRVQHQDAFYNDLGDFPYLKVPLIKPFYISRPSSNSPWRSNLEGLLWASQDYSYGYYYVEDVRKLSVENGIIMAYSPYVDGQADPSIQENYYHWFVVVPDKNIAAGFKNEEPFLEYIQKLGIQRSNWRAPDDLYREIEQTGCLDWIPDCK